MERRIALSMGAASVRAFLGVAGLVGFLAAGCGATQSTVAGPKAPPSKKEDVAVQQPEPPQPLATSNVAFEQTWDFVKLTLTDVSADWLVPEDELVKKLPGIARPDFQAVLRAEKQYDATEEQSRKARLAVARATKKQGAVAAYRAARKAETQALQAIQKARAKAEESLEKALAKGPVVPEVRLALIRLRTGHMHPDYDSSKTLAYGYSVVDGESRAVAPSLRQVVGLTSVGDPLGKSVRFELIHHLMATENATDAEPYINDLLGVVSWDKKPLLLLRLGIIQSLRRQHGVAAETFRSAYEHLATSSQVDRKTLLVAELVARYRAQQFERVLDVAGEHWKEWHDPTTPKPDPDPPSPTQTANGRSGVRASGTLSVLTGSSSGVFGSSLSDGEVLHFATDAAERLERDPARMQGDPHFRAGIAARLAVRALYRNDVAAAKAHGENAMTLGGTASQEGLRVLRVLAKRAGDKRALRSLDEARVPYGRASRANGIEHRYLDEELQEKSATEEKDSGASPVERNVRSLIRLCVEPLYQDLPEKAELGLSAKVFPGGKVELTLEGTGGSEVDACVKRMATRVFAHAPGSVSAKVALGRLDPVQGLGSILGGGTKTK